MPVLSHWECGSYPIFINPTFPEIVRLAESKWDSVRICVEGDTIALASGLGNTHFTVTDKMRTFLKNKWLLPRTYILYKQHGDFFFNMEDVSGHDCEPWRDVLDQEFSEEHAAILRDLINNS